MIALTVIGIVLGFLLLDLAIQRYEKRKAAAKAVIELEPAAGRTAKELLSDFLMPLGFFFHPGHTWARIHDKGLVTVGADDFAQKALGRIDRVNLPKVGQELKSNTPAFKIIQGDKEATFSAPINGTVLEVNEQLKNNPGLIKAHPYKTGWVYKVKPSSIADDLKPLYIADKAVQWLKKEIAAFRNFLMDAAGKDSQLGLTVADGGVPISGVMEEFGPADWKNFQQRFLNADAKGGN
jgi:glycine cleavage system H lipoate-binding protein